MTAAQGGPVALRRGIGMRTVVSTSTGLAFAAIEYLAVAGLLSFVAGDLAWLAVVTAGLLILLAWGFFGELNGLFPTAAAIRLYMARSMDDRAALTITFTYMSTIVLVLAADAYIVGSAITHVLHQPAWVTSLYIALLLGAAALSNLRGVTVAGAVQDVATYTIVAVTVLLAAVAAAHPQSAAAVAADASRHHGVGAFIQAVALGVLLYSAFEWVTTNAEEVRHERLIPRGMLISLGVLCLTCALLAAGMGRLLSAGELGTAYPQLYLGRRVAGTFGYALMCGITALTALNTFNGGFITASRFIYATAREGALPRKAALLNSRAVPWVPVVALAISAAVVSVGVSITHSWQVILAAGAALESLIYAVAGYCVLVLRRRQPAAERPFRLRAATTCAVLGMVVFGFLAVTASLSVDDHLSVAPLAVILVVGALAGGYVLALLPRVRAAEAARRAAQTPRRPRPAPASAETT